MSKLNDIVTQCRISDWQGCKPLVSDYPVALNSVLDEARFGDAIQEISSWSGYQSTPLRSLSALAAECGVAEVTYKDESGRFGLGSFKALGGAYAVFLLTARQLQKTHGIEIATIDLRNGVYADKAREITVSAATDGNHGRSVAWGARLAGCKCRIFIHSEVSEGRAKAMADLGAMVIRVDGDYDHSVRECAEQSKANGWHVISDTSWDGYTEIPKFVMAGYGVMVEEIFNQSETLPTHVIVPAGVGGLAAAVLAGFWIKAGKDLPRFIIVESKFADCILQSARNSQITSVDVAHETLMAGLSCGEASQIAWEILSRGISGVVSVDDDPITTYMRLAAEGALGGGGFEAGECSTSGMIALSAVSNNEEVRNAFGIDAQSRILLFGTEGATDPDFYRRVIEGEV